MSVVSCWVDFLHCRCRVASLLTRTYHAHDMVRQLTIHKGLQHAHLPRLPFIPNHVPNSCYLDGRGKVRLEVGALAGGYLCVMRDILCVHTHSTHTHTHTHAKVTKQARAQRRLSPEFYDNIIRLPIPISSVVLMMIGVLPMHPSPHVSFARCWLGRVAYIVPR